MIKTKESMRCHYIIAAPMNTTPRSIMKYILMFITSAVLDNILRTGSLLKAHNKTADLSGSTWKK